MVPFESFKVKNANPFEHFFGFPYEIGEIKCAKSTLDKNYVFESFFAKLRKNRKFYNYFIGEKGVGVFVMYPDFSVSKEVIFYKDRHFLEKISKYERNFCKKAVTEYQSRYPVEYIKFENRRKIPVSKKVVGVVLRLFAPFLFIGIIVLCMYTGARFYKGHIAFMLFVALVLWAIVEGLIESYVSDDICRGKKD